MAETEMIMRNALRLKLYLLVLLTTSLAGCGYNAQYNPTAQYSRFAYVANTADNTISSYTIDEVTGQLRPTGQTRTGGAHPISVTLDPTGKHAYVANLASGDISVFTSDASTGKLTLNGSPVAAGRAPRAVTVGPTGDLCLCGE